jgi:hypothetical protein
MEYVSRLCNCVYASAGNYTWGSAVATLMVAYVAYDAESEIVLVYFRYFEKITGGL